MTRWPSSVAETVSKVRGTGFGFGGNLGMLSHNRSLPSPHTEAEAVISVGDRIWEQASTHHRFVELNLEFNRREVFGEFRPSHDTENVILSRFTVNFLLNRPTGMRSGCLGSYSSHSTLTLCRRLLIVM